MTKVFEEKYGKKAPLKVHREDIHEFLGMTIDLKNPELLDEKNCVLVHSTTVRLLFLGKRARPDIQTVIAFLCTRVKVANVDDYKKLERVMKYLYVTLYMPLILGTNKIGNIHWYKDGTHIVHPNMRGHTGLVVTLGHRAVLSASWKQKINTMS